MINFNSKQNNHTLNIKKKKKKKKHKKRCDIVTKNGVGGVANSFCHTFHFYNIMQCKIIMQM